MGLPSRIRDHWQNTIVRTLKFLWPQACMYHCGFNPGVHSKQRLRTALWSTILSGPTVLGGCACRDKPMLWKVHSPNKCIKIHRIQKMSPKHNHNLSSGKTPLYHGPGRKYVPEVYDSQILVTLLPTAVRQLCPKVTSLLTNYSSSLIKHLQELKHGGITTPQLCWNSNFVSLFLNKQGFCSNLCVLLKGFKVSS